VEIAWHRAPSEGSGTPVAAVVSEVRSGYNQSLVQVRIDTNGNDQVDGTVKAARNNPFWVVGTRWLEAGLLELGDELGSGY
jgi:hypothetical protein